MNILPDEILSEIIGFLDANSWYNFKSTCQNNNKLANSSIINFIWNNYQWNPKYVHNILINHHNDEWFKNIALPEIMLNSIIIKTYYDSDLKIFNRCNNLHLCYDIICIDYCYDYIKKNNKIVNCNKLHMYEEYILKIATLANLKCNELHLYNSIYCHDNIIADNIYYHNYNDYTAIDYLFDSIDCDKNYTFLYDYSTNNEELFLIIKYIIETYMAIANKFHSKNYILLTRKNVNLTISKKIIKEYNTNYIKFINCLK